MNQIRAISSPELLPSSPTSIGQPGQECGFEGVATNVKLLLKLIQDHNGGSPKDNVERKTHRVAGMISIIDEVKNRIQKIQTTSKRRAELRRCNTDVKPNIPSPRDKKTSDLLITDEKERLRRDLHSSLMARQNLQAMCSSLGKEKQIMASELARKAQELTEMEEFISDLKEQNEMLMAKLQASNSEQKEKKSSGAEMQGSIALQGRNKELSEQLQKSLDSLRSLKRKSEVTQEENTKIHATMEEMEVEIRAGIDRLHGFKEKLATTDGETGIIKEEISALEHMLESLNLKISKHRQKESF